MTIPPTYTGQKHVRLGNGQSIFIAHTGSSYILTKAGDLVLIDLFNVPQLTINLIWVRKLCLDKNVSIEFFPNSFYAKDLANGMAILEGGVEDVLYKLPSIISKPQQPQNFVSTVKNKGLDGALWNDRLGH